ncbi:hypothetical protein [Arthrobacter sp. AD-310]
MAERGSNKHGSELDDQMKHEAQAAVHGTKPPHAEEFRETEPFPDDTDAAEVRDALKPVATPDPSDGGEGEQ